MSWLDPQRSGEPASETALREELRSLLGMKPRNFFETEPTPELNALADRLRGEARRRNHTTRHRSHWMLMAAALPLALAFGGVSAWGIAQKHKAEDLAVAVHRQEGELAKLAAAAKHAEPGAPAQPVQPGAMLASHRKPARTTPKGMELVEPVAKPEGQIPQDTQQVKAH